ncbi:hypothetical protein [Clostridium sp. Marseille-P3244]|uniref:hypothetical protein n=1 Tax=Clostridium sp. Marseille-P3244 TaxID=1871020 RepID=UPI00093145D2|nr:hypothetical protein [Clostridium sp. Marseille-P3244]
MNEKMPYYMAYPMPFSYEDERTERMDLEYLRSMYPDLPKRILPYVEEECDRMEYENSMIYDQYPDKLQLKLMCGRVCDNVRKHERMLADELEEVNASERDRNTSVGKRGMERSGTLRDLIEVMLFQELYRRRCNHRRRCRRFY